MKTTIYSMCFCVLFLGSCFRPKPQITQYQKRVKERVNLIDAKAKEKVDVEFFATRPSLHKAEKKLPKTINDLSPKGQKAFIEQFAGLIDKDVNDDAKNKGKRMEKFKGALLLPVSKQKPTGSSVLNYAFQDVTLNFDVLNKSIEPVDRISKLRITVKLQEKARKYVRFKSFNKFSNRYEVKEFGQLTASDSRTFALNVGGEIAGSTGKSSGAETSGDGFTDSAGSTRSASSGGSASASAGVTKAIAEAKTLNRRFVGVKGMLSDDQIYIVQEGYEGKDLNERMDIGLQLEFFNCLLPQKGIVVKNLFDKKGNPVKDESKIILGHKMLYVPSPSIDIKVDITYEFVYREPVKGRSRNETLEAAQVVRLYQSPTITVQKPEAKENEKGNILVKKKDVGKVIWEVKDTSDQGSRLNIVFKGQSQPVRFGSEEQVYQFVTWLKLTGNTTFKGYKLTIGGAALTAAKLKDLFFEKK